MARIWYRVNVRLASLGEQEVVALVRVRATSTRDAAEKAVQLLNPAAISIIREAPAEKVRRTKKRRGRK